MSGRYECRIVSSFAEEIVSARQNYSITCRVVRIGGHTGPGGVFPLYVHRQTRRGNGVTPCVLSGEGQSAGAGANRMARGKGSRQKPKPLGKPEDRQTDVRLNGMESFQVGCT